MSFILNFLLVLRQQVAEMGERYPPDYLGNFPDSTNSYVVGIPLSPSTLYLDNPTENRNCMSPSDFGLRKRANTSFQITSVTVQGSRMNNEDFDDSADDYDESHTDDISSDILDSSRVTEPDGYQSEDATNTNFDDLSPCGPLLITPLPSTMNDANMNVGLGINMSPPFPAMSTNMVSSGVTMMTSSSESPVSAHVPIINNLPDNWQHRFKVVKIVSSEPFKRGRWLCMDFKDPPQPADANKTDSNGVPAIQVTPCAAMNYDLPPTDQNKVTHVIGIPVGGTFNESNSTCDYNQPFYGIFVPHDNYSQPNVVNEFSADSIINMSVNQNGNINAVHSYGHVVPHDYGTPNTVLPRHVLENNANNNVPTNCIYLNGNGIDSVSVADSDSYIKSVPTTIVHVPPDKVIPRTISQADGNESFCTFANQLRQTYGLTKSNQAQMESILINDIGGEQINTNFFAHSPTPVPSPPVLPSVTLPSASCDVPCSTAPSGASTVAIDNKIEQAMDLVKSHLMFAVREEVEVLKEKISELLERISQLEHENELLRANASPETLKQLKHSQKKFTGHTMLGKQIGMQPHIQNQPPAS